MEKFNKLKSIPAYMPLLNIDTDMIIPKQFLKTIKRTGLGKNLFFEMRYDEKGKIIKDFIFNKKPFNESKILLAGKNFGCGSSREHAPWALLDFGIKCVIAPSFADIFYNNCFKNGILPIVLNEKIIQEIAEYSKREENIEIKLESQEILFGNKAVKFDLDLFKKKCLLEGLDDIALSLKKLPNIQNYETKIKNSKPWLTNND
ncbi:MAG: 3-isopropylmalate dehydratase small subunit [Pelagibacteraceae bacterium]|jgi:3-isopropylmalate/(R)-2-methylmalate dehydratase small subunit|nr:3-isopropylmalate dehydratase small subunit [Pelagibacteraceae bacterium]